MLKRSEGGARGWVAVPYVIPAGTASQQTPGRPIAESMEATESHSHVLWDKAALLPGIQPGET
jgi:hypothetical protein